MVLNLDKHNDVTCRNCGNTFCCAKCRLKHELNTHTIFIHQSTKPSCFSIKQSISNKQLNEIYLFCAICECRPLRLTEDMDSFLLQHVVETHMPLQCQNCCKLYETVDDLKNCNKCYHNPAVLSCNLPQLVCTNDTTRNTIKKTETQTISTQTSPWTKSNHNRSDVTPRSGINMPSKHKSKLTHELIGDSVSSIRNISLASNNSIKRWNSHSQSEFHSVSSTAVGKIIRSTSTPVQLGIVVAKPNMPSFDASGNGQVSSIHSSGCDTEENQVLLHSVGTNSNNKKTLESTNGVRKILIGRTKIQPNTPLRQVMSKSIQKALVQHGMVPTSFLVPYNCRYKSDSITSSNVQTNQTQAEALDLRLSPALRRSQNDGGCERTTRRNMTTPHSTARKFLMSAHKLTTTESIVITRTKQMSRLAFRSENGYLRDTNFSTNSNYQSTASNNGESTVYKTCSSVKIIRTTTELSELNIQQDDNKSENGKSGSSRIKSNNILVSMTPIARLPGAAVNKKFIKFETPVLERSTTELLNETANSPQEVYYTPETSPTHEYNDAKTPVLYKFVPRNLVKHFSMDTRPPFIKRCMQTTAFSRTEDFNKGNTCHLDDEVFLEDNKCKEHQKVSNANKQQFLQQDNVPCDQQRRFRLQQHNTGIWSKITSMLCLPTFNDTMRNTSKETNDFNSRCSTSIIKHCASIAGPLLRATSDHGGEIQTLKRKRAHTTDNQYTSTFLSKLNSFECASPPLNARSKRLRIQGRCPIRQTSIKEFKKI